MGTVVITGGTSGVGRATAEELAKLGWKVVFIARNREKAEKVKDEISASAANQNIEFVISDFTSVDQVRECAETISERYPQIDALINNAGVCLPEKRITADGLEESFQINYLSHFILSNLLIDNLKRSDDPRIINLSSLAHIAGRFDPENLNREMHYGSFRTYADTKLYNILFTLELAARLSNTGITVNAVHPGVVSTNFGNEFGAPFNFIYNIGRIFMISPEKGARTSVFLATSDNVKGITGRYFVRCKQVKLRNRFLTEENRKLLWEKSMELSGMD